ncbi:MAG TPA: HepT-like ribonuclease domain-containing protein, partial [Gaiellaceae bacterium]|nr:HepT-like ribonuclease domain-containing protein [Gaiellaceae bacterium]
VKNLDGATRGAAPDVAWDDIAGLRDLIAHEYFRIDIERILAIVNRDLPALGAAVDRLLAGDG